jgi:hypothetical protein
MSDRWFFRQRQEWIASTIRIFGFINREHLERKFEISTPQASADLQYFQKNNPGVLEYNKSTKRYEDAERIANATEVRESYNAMLEELNKLCSDFGCLGGEHRLNWLRAQLERLRHLENLEAHPLLAVGNTNV